VSGDPGESGAAGGSGEGVPPQLSGPDLVRQALARAKAASRARGTAPRRTGSRPARPRADGDSLEPMRVGQAIQRLVAEKGWEDTTTRADVLANWHKVVGPDIADHCRPVSLEDGELVLVAESTAWATQLRLLTKTLLKRVQDHAGPDIATKVVVRGPVAPDWRKGKLRVQGRGPRDTYG
jgi:predicted nucleic acid-binding Zn ribbon protein